MCNLFDTIYSRYNLWMLLPQTYTALKRDLGDATVYFIYDIIFLLEILLIIYLILDKIEGLIYIFHLLNNKKKTLLIKCHF